MEGKELLGDQYFTFLGISLVGMLISGAVPLILVGPVYCGMALCLLKQARNGPMVFDDLFKGFEYFGQSIIAALVYFGATLVVFIPFAIAYVAGMVMIASGEGPLIGIGIVLLILVVLMSSFVTVMGGVVNRRKKYGRTAGDWFGIQRLHEERDRNHVCCAAWSDRNVHRSDALLCADAVCAANHVGRTFCDLQESVR
jgi:Na+-transporting methylmalonyl-CoA/oxaloacetate decarboxylase gamma subunit